MLAEKLFDRQPELGDTLRIGSVPFTIIGVLDKKGQNASGESRDDVVVIPLTTARSRVIGSRRRYNRQALDYIIVKFYESDALEAIKREITDVLRQRHRLNGDAPDDFSIYNPADILATQEGSARIFGILLASIASVSLIVGGISIMNIMLVSVSERTREIGLRMAVGARRRDIRRQFLDRGDGVGLDRWGDRRCRRVGGGRCRRILQRLACAHQPMGGRAGLRVFDPGWFDFWRLSRFPRGAARSDGGAALRMNARGLWLVRAPQEP